ncbi:LD-carboxypeptidase [Myxococcota bacterium]|nr:LD-carboxypeptidase [Myxococcota bacterium]MBU1381596.1 LD-carboxypeptidase [Myxococcota bacterium]MBU1496860.1 LD-carboxypeptidase [Myxococcota bacterium]
MNRKTRAGIVFPGSSVDIESINKSLSELADIADFTVFPADNKHQNPYFSGTDYSRTASLTQAISDHTDILVPVRGGYGSIRLNHPELLAQLEKYPVPISGFSDLTILLELWSKNGFKAYHAPVMNQYPFLNTYSQTAYRHFLAQTKLPSLELVQLGSAPEARLYPVKGGNLTVFASMVGTSVSPSFKDHFVLIEDINEPAYKVDRCLQQLIQGTDLKKASGIIIGDFTNCSGIIENTIIDILYSNSFKIPVFKCHDVGHGSSNFPFEYGGMYKFTGISENRFIMSPEASQK